MSINYLFSVINNSTLKSSNYNKQTKQIALSSSKCENGYHANK